jgi:hypothetical protein
MKVMTDQQIYELAFEALDTAIGLIQQRLGIMSGDAASHIFSDRNALRLFDLFEDYIRFEINNLR